MRPVHFYTPTSKTIWNCNLTTPYSFKFRRRDSGSGSSEFRSLIRRGVFNPFVVPSYQLIGMQHNDRSVGTIRIISISEGKVTLIVQ